MSFSLNPNSFPTRRVITICSLKHADVWKLTSRLLIEHLPADEYFLYVPHNEIEEFRQITPNEIRVIAQETLGADYREPLMQAVQDSGNINRYGWYLQQLYKIEALLDCERDLGIIWDADCVPIQPIPVLDSQSKIVYMDVSTEYNPPYFAAIERLLGMARVQSQCFVIPCFPFWSAWGKEFVHDLETKSQGQTWWEAIISQTDLSLTSGFSETETLGTWVANRHGDSWVSVKGHWERYGQRRFGYARKFSVRRLKRVTKMTDLDIVAFENWDIRGFKLFQQKIKSILTGGV